MKFSEQWLREWVNPPLSTAELAEQLTMAGLEVDAVAPVAPNFAGVVVGEIVAVAAHPNADALRVCQVHVGDTQPLTIVCGAPNARVGLRAPLAIVGAELPNQVVIKETAVRGVTSQGMLCSAQELGLSEQSAGLLELPSDTRVGEDVYEYLRLDDVSIELGLTPNRGDCLSIAGVAREVAALTQSALHAPAIEPVAHVIKDKFDVAVSAPADCPRYVGRVLRGVNQNAITPLWMQERLRRGGLRSISAVVDVTNYVMLELGQPMHAFDLDKLQGGIQVRHARAGETLTLLDGQTVTLQPGTLLITDHSWPLALAGIMGGLDSAIGPGTTALFLESAFFAPQAVVGRARGYGLHTDSSFRFERGVDPDLPRRAMERATALLLQIVGGQAGPIIEVCSQAHLPARAPVPLRAERLRRVLGADIAPGDVTDILARLNMQPVTQPQGWQATPPSYRFDIAIEADLIEEIARIHGYNRLPSHHPQAELAMTPQPEAEVNLGRMRQLLADRGYQEIVTYSFVDPAWQRLLDPEHAPLALANPISSDMSVMRTTLWCGLLQTLLYNQKRQQTRLRLFESGLNFIKQDNELKQEMYIAGVMSGNAYPEQWAMPARPADFYDIKADIEALAALTGENNLFRFSPSNHPALHPGQSAQINRDGHAVGWAGALHPAVANELGLHGGIYLFELQFAALAAGSLPKFRELSKFPAIRRDIAVIIDATLPAQAVLDCAAQAAGELLQELQVFDVYQGKGIDLGRKSLALGLTLQASSRTLTDQEADALVSRIITTLNNKFGATLRT
ncbi:MAG: phenylalanine--tRNA ligase subunit beta [Pseudomonadota bacterium]